MKTSVLIAIGLLAIAVMWIGYQNVQQARSITILQEACMTLQIAVLEMQNKTVTTQGERIGYVEKSEPL